MKQIQDDEFSSGVQCRLFSLVARPTTMEASMRESDDGGTDSHTSGWSVVAGLRRNGGNTKPMEVDVL